jgi:hypothetical protein
MRTPEDMQHVLDQLVDKGWASRAKLVEKSTSQQTVVVDWTEAGKARMRAMLILIRELEGDSGRLQPGEFLFLSSLLSYYEAQDASRAWPAELPTPFSNRGR